MNTLKSKLLHTDNNSYTEWMDILNHRFDLQPLLHAIKFDAFKNDYKGSDQKYLLENLINLYLCYQELLHARSDDEDVTINGTLILASNKIRQLIFKYSQIIDKIIKTSNSIYFEPTVLLANLVGKVNIVLECFKSSDPRLYYYQQGQDIFSVLFEPSLSVEYKNPLDITSMLYNPSVMNPMYHHLYKERLKLLLDVTEKYPQFLFLDQPRSTKRFRFASLLHLLIEDALLLTSKELDAFKAMWHKMDEGSITFQLNDLNLSTFLKRKNKVPYFKLKDFRRVQVKEKRLLKLWITQSSINQKADDGVHSYHSLSFSKSENLSGITPVFEAIRSKKRLAYDVLIKDKRLDLDMTLQHRPLRRFITSSSNAFIKDDNNHKLHQYPDRLNSRRRTVKAHLLDYFPGASYVPMKEDSRFLFSEWLALQGYTKTYANLLIRDTNALRPFQIGSYLKVHGPHALRHDIFKITELAHASFKTIKKSILLNHTLFVDSPVKLHPKGLDKDLIHTMNRIESKHIIPAESYQFNMPFVINLDGKRAIDMIQDEIRWNSYFKQKVEAVRRAYPYSKHKKEEAIREKKRSIALSNFEVNVKYEIGKTSISVSLRPKIGHAGNCFVKGLGRGKYTDIMAALDRMTNKEVFKERAVAEYFLQLASGQKTSQAFITLNRAGIAKKHLNTLHHIYYLIVIREVSRRYQTGRYLHGTYPKQYPFCLAQYCGLYLVSKGCLKVRDVLSQDADYGLPTGDKVCTQSKRSKSTKKLTNILRKFVLSFIPQSVVNAYDHLSSGFILGLSEQGYHCLMNGFVKGCIQPMKNTQKPQTLNFTKDQQPLPRYIPHCTYKHALLISC